jgi:hypothetical protein
MVWVPMLPGDSRARWDKSLLDDDRVLHFWDERLVTGTWLAAHARALGLAARPEIVWDTFFVFGARARWTDAPPRAVAAGAPVLARSEVLRRALASVSHRPR